MLCEHTEYIYKYQMVAMPMRNALTTLKDFCQLAIHELLVVRRKIQHSGPYCLKCVLYLTNKSAVVHVGTEEHNQLAVHPIHHPAMPRDQGTKVLNHHQLID